MTGEASRRCAASKALTTSGPISYRRAIPISFDEADHRSRWTYEFLGTRNQIDHILLLPSIEGITRPDTPTRRGIRPRVPDRPNPVASDHRPFVLTLDFL